jgi:hypothetical protein
MAQDYNKINGRHSPVLRAIKFLVGGETEDRGPRFSQRAVQQDDDREKGPITWTLLKLPPALPIYISYYLSKDIQQLC